MGQLDRSADFVRTVMADVADTEDAREAYCRIHRAIVEAEARGETVPTELIKIRETVAIECTAQSQGR